MNPFTESTVARPRSEPFRTPRVSSEARGAAHRAQAATVSAPARTAPVSASPSPRRRVRRGLRRGLRHTALSCAFILGAGLLSTQPARAVDVNVATLEQLREVRGIGPKTAQIIIDERGRGGRFESFSDLSDRVKGIGPKKAAALQAAGLSLGGAVPAATKPAAPVAGKPPAANAAKPR